MTHIAQRRAQQPFRRLSPIVCLLVSLVAGQGLLPPPVSARAPDPPRRVNAPYFGADIDWGQTAIFWFGENEQGDPPTRNYADVRVGYTADALEIRVTVADYYLWYDENAGPSSDLTRYDAVAIYLDTDHDQTADPQSDDYSFLIGARTVQNIVNYMRQARGDGSGWDAGWTPSTAWTAESAMSWSCNPGPNSNECGLDFGWTAIFVIPWGTLGLSGQPADGTICGLGVRLYDRDDGPPDGYVSPQHWPEAASPDAPSTWGELAFSPPAYEPLPAVPEGTTTIRRARATDTSIVQDAWVGGGAWCSGGHEGGADVNHGGFNPDGSVKETELFAGSEVAVTHLPCFSKSFLRFYLDDVPAGKAIISATLTLHHWGNSGDPSAPKDEDRPHDSYVWLYSISDAWTETGITWNNAPLAQKNLDGMQITPLSSHPGWPGVPYTWDATEAVSAAYAAGQPVDLAIYDSANERNTSKYFTSSETGDWNAEGRPTLTVAWGSTVGTVEKTASPSIAMPGVAITYTLAVVGSGQPLILTDDLPAGVSRPLASSPGLAYTPHRLTWTGDPGPGEPAILTYVVTITALSRVALWNRAVLTQSNGLTDTAAALVLVDPVRVYLPLVLRDE
jgi:hypothetical protein